MEETETGSDRDGDAAYILICFGYIEDGGKDKTHGVCMNWMSGKN